MVTTNNEPNANIKITYGRDKVTPYSSDSGLNKGADSANADMAPAFNFARRISIKIGRTPMLQTGSNIPTAQDWGSERKLDPPKSRRIPLVPR